MVTDNRQNGIGGQLFREEPAVILFQIVGCIHLISRRYKKGRIGKHLRRGRHRLVPLVRIDLGAITRSNLRIAEEQEVGVTILGRPASGMYRIPTRHGGRPRIDRNKAGSAPIR